MPIEVLMPALSPTMTEGKLAKWLVKEGDDVTSGDVLAEIETDKATMEVEAVDEGKIGKLLVAEGSDNVPVNQVIALLLGEDELIVNCAFVLVAGPERESVLQSEQFLDRLEGFGIELAGLTITAPGELNDGGAIG